MQKCGVVTADEDAKETPCSLMFPELVMRNHARLPALEVGIDYFPERLEIGWLRYLEDCTCQFVESTNFQRKATIWNWCGISVNLSKGNSRPLGRSMFHVVFGLPSKFLSLLELHMQRHLGWDNARVTEYITVNDDDGWVPVCHVEQGKVWKPLDAAEWELVISRSKVAAEPAVEPLSAESTERMRPLTDRRRLNSGRWLATTPTWFATCARYLQTARPVRGIKQFAIWPSLWAMLASVLISKHKSIRHSHRRYAEASLRTRPKGWRSTVAQ